MSFNILELAQQTKSFWTLKSRSALHCAVSCVISQRIRLNCSRKILSKLYILLEADEFTKDKLDEIKDDELIEIGIDSKKIDTIRRICLLAEVNEKTLKIKGVGPWTIKAWKISMNEQDEMVKETIPNDKYVIKRVFELYGDSGRLDDIIKPYSIEESNMIMNFLWRIKETGVESVKLNRELYRSDFI